MLLLIVQELICSCNSKYAWIITALTNGSVHFDVFTILSGKVSRLARKWLWGQNKPPAIMISLTWGLFYFFVNETYHCADGIAYVWAFSKAEAGPRLLGVYGMFPVRNRLVMVTWRVGIMVWFSCVTVTLLAWLTPLNRKSMNSKKRDPYWPKFRLPS